MSNCVYEFTDADGKPQKIVGMAAMKAYMAETGMGLDMAGVKVTGQPEQNADFDSIFDAALDEAFGKEESKADLLSELRARLSNLGMRAMDAGDGAMAGRISGFTVGMHDTNPIITRAWVDEVVAEREKAVAKLERKKAPAKPKTTKRTTNDKSNLVEAAKQAGILEVVHVGDKKASKAEVTSETARKAQFNLTSGAEAKVTEHAEHGKFTVMVAGESYGSFLMSDAGKVSGIKARANWAKDSVSEAANTFAAMQRGETTNVADASRVVPATKSAMSAAKNVGMGLSDVAKGLGALFGPKPGQLNSGIGFDEKTYEAAKPYFLAGIAHFKDAAADIQATVFSLVKTLRDQFGMDRATIFRMKPYLERFVKDVQNGVIDGEGNESQIQSTGAEALDGMATKQGGGTEVGGATGPGAADGSGEGDTPSGGADAAGVSAARSGGSGVEGVHPSKPRGKSKRSGSDRAGKAGARVSSDAQQGAGDSGRGGRTGPTGDDSKGVEPPNVPALNYRITEDTRLGKGGEVEKFNDNIAAIKTLKQIEAERRRATPEEQRILARYVGWGGLANAFADPQTGEFKDKWRERGEMLRDLLTKQELDKARNSTTAAHYTSETVVRAMWDAAKRLGFKGGLTLENSMGVGNFLGLAPEGIDAKFIGVEYDGLTARIAQALYPQATVLHAGFDKTPIVDNAFMLNIGNPPFGKESLNFQFKPELSGVSIHNQFFRAGMDALRPGGLQIKVVSRFLMDAEDKSTRLALASQAKLLGVIRLPDTAFKENARTEVVTDIVILQKLSEAEQVEMGHAVDAYRQKPSRDATAERERLALAAKVPSWVETAKVNDPLGGEPITINRYLAENPSSIMGVLERSGSMRQGNDVTVRLDNPERLSEMLSDAVARLPEGVQNFDAEVLAATEARFKSMSDALRIAIAQEEIGHLKIDEDGKLQRVIERETPEGGVELMRQEITPTSPWSDHLNQDANGNWYRLVAQVDESGAKIKAVDKNGKVTNRNVYDREVFASDADVPDSLRLGETGYARLVGMVGLRDLLKAQLVMETEDAEPKGMEANRRKLAKAYEAFVSEHGPVSRPVNLSLAMTMPDGGLVAALEVAYQPARNAAQAAKSGLPVQDEVATPAPVMRERVVPKYEPATSAANPADALAIALSESGRVNMERIASLLGISQDEAAARLQEGDAPLVFKDPESGSWETADNYLSGMVKRKLKAAQEAGLAKNIAALEAVQPEPWTAENVTVTFGAGWVPADVYASFVEHLVGGSAKVTYSGITNSFTLSTKAGDRNKLESWGSEGASFEYIMSRALNSQSVTVTYRDSDGGTHVDREKTDLANLKAKEIRNEFSDWVFADTERRERLVAINNELFNVRVTRQHNGQHLTLPGKVPDSIIKMRRHQLNAIWRGIYERFMLVDHAVGAGKTFTAIARAMERRRMGLSKKPMIVVPNHLVEQWAADVYRLYPGAKVLAAGKKDFEVKNRRRLLGKIATGDWDIVIMPHSSFGGIGIAPETERRYLEQELALALDAVKDAEEQAKEDGTDSGWRKPFGVKQAEALVKQIEGRMEKVSSGVRDRMLTFEQLGVDDLTVDESHEFKNLYYSSRLTGVRGMGDRSGSRKANDLYNKVRTLRDSPTGSVTFMTGTPISNSAVEMYTVMRYLASESLHEMGLENFDAWRTQFVEHTTKFEPTEDGSSLKEVSRLGRTWSNMRSLMELYYQFTDAVSLEDIQRWYSEDNGGKEFPVPKLKGGDRQLIKVKPTKAQESFLKEIIQGFDSLPDIEDVFERNKARLRLMDQARKVSLDVRAVSPGSTSEEKGGKLELVSNEVKRLYDKWDSVKGTQLIFLDRGVPSSKGDAKTIKEYDDLRAKRESALMSGDTDAYERITESLEKYNADEIEALRIAQNGGWNAYQQIKDNLVAMGVPANEIRFVQEANTDEQKQALFDAVRGGKIRVLIGSTPRMGAGTNVQDRLVGLHHVDVTWKPSDIEQREGRIIRQGNIFATPPSKGKPNPHYRPDFEVEILAYATERTVDAKMWDLNATKLRTINGIRKYDGAFTMDFEDADSVSMAEMAAAASGNPLLLERVQLESEINLLELQERAHRRKMYGAVDAVRRAKEYIEKNPQRIESEKGKIEAARERALALEKAVNARTVTVEGQTYTERSEAAKAAMDLIQEQKAGDEKAKFAVNINGKRYTSKDATFDAVDAAFGDATPFEMVIDGRTTGQRTVAGRDVASMLNVSTSEMSGDTNKEIELGTVLGLRLVAGLERRVFEGNATIDGDIALIDSDGRTVVSEYLDRKEAHIAYNTTGIKNVLDRVFARMLAQTSDFTLIQLEHQLKRAKEEIDSLEVKAGEKFPEAGKLDQKRKRLLDVVSLLERGPTTEEEARWNPGEPKFMAPAPAMFSTSDGSVVKPASELLSLSTIANEVENRIGKFAHQPPIRILDSAIGVFDNATSDSHISGAVHGGVIYLFRDELPTLRDVQRTLFHELLHYGLRRFLTKEQFTGKMLDLYARDTYIKEEADRWAQTDEGKAAEEFGGAEFAKARGVDEALATLSEPNMGEYMRHAPMAVLARRVMTWLANVADFLGFKEYAAELRSKKNVEARAFIKTIFQKLETNAAPASDGFDFTADTAFRAGSAADEGIKAGVVTNIKSLAGYKATDLMGIGLQALGRRQLVDIYGDMLPMDGYNHLTAQMEADKNDGGAEADELVTRWAKLKDERELAELMHDATLAQVDPGKPLRPYASGAEKAKYKDLRAKFDALSEDAKNIYLEARTSYQRHHFRVRGAIAERVARSELSNERKAALLKKMDMEFFKAIKGVYFPLARFGQYVVAVRGADGMIASVSRAETMSEAVSLRKTLMANFPEDQGYQVGEVTRDRDFSATRDSVGRGFMKDLYEVLEKQNLTDDQRAELEDTLGQLYLQSLPDLSWAKHGIHRNGTPGFSQDARRAFAQNMFHGARYLAKLKYSDKMQDELNRMQKAVDKMAKAGDPNQPRAQQVVDEMVKRHESYMNPKSSPVSTALTSFGFLFHLGLSPASAIVNLSQTAFVAYPVMGAKWGFDKASAALLKASGQAMAGKNDITHALTREERAAYDAAVRAGTIDVTMAHDLAGIAQGEDVGVLWKIRPVMRAASYLFHHAERFNRQVTFIAAYRLAREAGATDQQAQEQATQATYDGHFDYSAANRPRFMQGNVAKVILLFKQYAQNMLYTMLRNAYVGFVKDAPGSDEKAKAKEARRVIYGLAAMTQVAAGAMGMPWLVTAIPLAIAQAIGGDDDEAWDAEVALRNYLADAFGQTFADVFMHGFSRMTPFDISGRVGLDKLIFPDVQEGLSAGSWVESFGFGMAGAVPGILLNWGKGIQNIAQGHVALGIEGMMPVVLRNAMKSVRYAMEGAQDKTGVAILDEVSTLGVLGQAVGFSPSAVRNATEAKTAIREADKAISERRQSLMTKFAKASMAKDIEAMQEIRKEISRFNSKNPERRITFENLTASVKARTRRITDAQQGVYLPKNHRAAMEAGRFDRRDDSE